MKRGLIAGSGLCLLLLLAAVGCTRGSTSRRPPIHPNPNMDRQPKYLPQSESGFFYDGSTMRQPVAGTVARGELVDPALTTGKSADGAFLAVNPLADREGLGARGEERFRIYCQPCHGESGNGQGMLFERSGVQSANLKDPRIVALPDGQIFDTITNGLGLMSGYKYPIPPEDRWAIVAHVRRLQQEAE
ncbi:MAG: cytochrome c [Acidobacteria bacterium]|nr:cytochrome c [Acidobacteriota bacterium]